MRFSDLAKHELEASFEAFGSYLYLYKSPESVLDIPFLMRSLKRLPTSEVLVELKHLATRTDCPLDPIDLVATLMNSLEKDVEYNLLFEDNELLMCCE